MDAGTQRIETDRLTLRAFRLQDAGSMYANWINDRAVQADYGEPVYGSLVLVYELLQNWISAYTRDDFYRWAIVLKEQETCIGQIAFCHVDHEHRQAELEYCIGQTYQNNGYATEALRAVIEYTFAHTGLHRLQAYHRGRNAVSGRVLQKAQMKYEGTLQESFYYPDTGKYDDKIYYGIIKGSV